MKGAIEGIIELSIRNISVLSLVYHNISDLTLQNTPVIKAWKVESFFSRHLFKVAVRTSSGCVLPS